MRSLWEILTHSGPGYLDSFAGLAFLLLVGRWFQQRTWHELSFERDYKSYFPVAATVRAGEEETTVPIQRLVPGDIIVVRGQEIIPADGILLKGPALIDYSFVTGEAAPVEIKSGDRIYAGGKQIGESIEISLTRRVSQSSLTRLWNDNAFKTQESGNVTRLADQAGRVFSWIILAAGGGAFLYWTVNGDFSKGINAFTAVMIVACPCTVALSIPFTLGNVMRMLGRHGFYVKNIKVVEAFSAIDTVVFDKTGTITNVAGHQMQFHGRPLSCEEKIAVRSLVRHSAHPLSRRIYEALSLIPVVKPDFFEEVTGKGVSGAVNGLNIKVGSSGFTGGEGQGVFVSVNGKTAGFYEVKSRYRTGLDTVLGFLAALLLRKKRTGQPVWLLSGDHDHEAVRLRPFFPDTQVMRFNQSPQDKLDFVKNMQSDGRKVMMIGDGLNDGRGTATERSGNSGG